MRIPIWQRLLQVWGFFFETTIPKAEHVGIGKLNNPLSEANGDDEKQLKEQSKNG